jgi:hypothetical protein
MDDQQQRVSEAAEKFAYALRESYQTVASRGESAQQLNAEMTQRFFNTVINHLQRFTSCREEAFSDNSVAGYAPFSETRKA